MFNKFKTCRKKKIRNTIQSEKIKNKPCIADKVTIQCSTRNNII